MLILKSFKMEITPKQQRNMYALFIGLFAVNVGIAIMNYREQKRLRQLQEELTALQLEEQKRKRSGSLTDTEA
jgi:hypothetical protein